MAWLANALWTVASWVSLTWHDVVVYWWHWTVLRHQITWYPHHGYTEKRCACNEVWY